MPIVMALLVAVLTLGCATECERAARAWCDACKVRWEGAQAKFIRNNCAGVWEKVEEGERQESAAIEGLELDEQIRALEAQLHAMERRRAAYDKHCPGSGLDLRGFEMDFDKCLAEASMRCAAKQAPIDCAF